MTTIQNETMNPYLERLNSARATFKDLHSRYAQLAGQIETQENAAKAAENEALEAKQKIREALRESATGRPTKKLHELKAEERSCYSLADEYRSFADDLRNERASAEIAACEAAGKYETLLLDAITEFAGNLVEAAVAALPRELFAGLMLTAQSEQMRNQHGGTPIWSAMVGVDTAEDYVLRLFGNRLTTIFRERKDDQFEFLPTELAEPLNVSYFVRSPLQLSAMKSALDLTPNHP